MQVELEGEDQEIPLQPVLFYYTSWYIPIQLEGEDQVSPYNLYYSTIPLGIYTSPTRRRGPGVPPHNMYYSTIPLDICIYQANYKERTRKLPSEPLLFYYTSWFIYQSNYKERTRSFPYNLYYATIPFDIYTNPTRRRGPGVPLQPVLFYYTSWYIYQSNKKERTRSSPSQHVLFYYTSWYMYIPGQL